MAKKSEVEIVVFDVADGKASVCAYVGDDLYEDPEHADIEKRLAQKAADRYIEKGATADDIRYGWSQLS